jgi:hypothetical protein
VSAKLKSQVSNDDDNLGTGPVSELLPSRSSEMTKRVLNEDGISPLRRLELRSMVLSRESFPKEDGIDPSR